MDVLKAFLEGLEIPACMMDLDSSQLLYLNPLMQKELGLQCDEAYQGQLCYTLLQGKNAPCSFCPNARLREGEGSLDVQMSGPNGEEIPVKAALLRWKDRRCRVSISLEQHELLEELSEAEAGSGNFLSECFQHIFSAPDPESALELVLAYIGERFGCTRVDVFEVEGDFVRNSYEWCRSGVTVEQPPRKKIPLDELSGWQELFRQRRSLIIEDMAQWSEEQSELRAVLPNREICTLAAGAIMDEQETCGFFDLENPEKRLLPQLPSALNVLSYFLSVQLKRRDLYRQLNFLSYRDSLTGTYNRNALYAHSSGYAGMRSLGILYCDINGLKQVNDTQGHNAGDQVIRRCCALLQQCLDTHWIYRVGGDEFLAAYPNQSRESLRKEEKALREGILQSGEHMALGWAWSDQGPLDPERLISQADRRMYADKRAFYQKSWAESGQERRCLPVTEERTQKSAVQERDAEEQFLAEQFQNLPAFLASISQDNYSSYFFFGDIQKNVYYLSDNLREKFGFEANVIPGFLQLLGQKVVSSQDRERYWNSLRKIRTEKRSIHDLRCQLRDVGGQSIWVRCYGMVQWDEEREIPLFFSGRITQQDEQFIVDPVTNFPKESVLLRRLEEQRENAPPCLVIGFSFNGVQELNSSRGRLCGDHLAKTVARELEERLGRKMSFYRLDGMRFAAQIPADSQESAETLVRQIRDIVRENYLRLDVTVREPSSFAVMEYTPRRYTPMDFLADMVTLIRAARQRPELLYVDDSSGSLKQCIREMSAMVLALNRDVAEGMQNFHVVIQPQISAESGEILGGEVLLRWRFGGKTISPEIFVPVLEKENMIQEVGRWIFRAAAEACAELQKIAPGHFLTVNVSRRQLEDQGFPQFIQDTLASLRLDGSCLVVEMTESCIDEGQQEQLNHFIQVCTQCGIRIALDDFGTGYSSLRVLLRYPSSIVKLDKSLTQEMAESREKVEFVSSIVDACHGFGKLVCMEGVENQKQHELACQARCDMIQGFFHHQPMTLEELMALLEPDRQK